MDKEVKFDVKMNNVDKRREAYYDQPTSQVKVIYNKKGICKLFVYLPKYIQYDNNNNQEEHTSSNCSYNFLNILDKGFRF